MSTSAHQVRTAICEAGARLYQRGLITANEGNVSVRVGDQLFVTPAGVCKGELRPEMIVTTDLAGRKQEGARRVSTEVAMHVAVYERRPDVTAVVHAHPPTATGFAVAGVALDAPLIAEAVVTLGPVPVIPYGTPSTADLARNVGAAICESHGLLLANHGALTVGDSLERAYERMETLEQLARVTLVARLLGRTNELPGGDVARLMGLRAAAGYPPPVCVDCPTCGTAVSVPPSPVAAGDRVTLTRDELVRLVTDAVLQFARR